MIADYADSENEIEISPGKGRIVIWLLVLALLGMLLPLYLVSSTIRNANLLLEEELAQLQADLQVEPTPNPQIINLEDTLTTLRTEVNTLQTTLTSLETQFVDWPVVMHALGSYDQTQLTVTALAQTGGRITLNGEAQIESAIVTYTRDLEQTGLFSRVIVQSITYQPETGTSTFALLVEVAPDVTEEMEN
ncbi:MAG: hypothetical protein OHK0046_25450 [Anaerolineae bacterium]